VVDLPNHTGLAAVTKSPSDVFSVRLARAFGHARLCPVTTENRRKQDSTFSEFPMPEIDLNGVDRSQIRKQLQRTPVERLLALENFLASVIQIRRGIRKTPISRDPSSTR
jgi:hypothetical protein